MWRSFRGEKITNKKKPPKNFKGSFHIYYAFMSINYFEVDDIMYLLTNFQSLKMVKIIIRLLSIFSKIVFHIRSIHWSDGCVLFYCGSLILLLWLRRVLCQPVVAGCNDVVALRCARVSRTSKNRPVNLPLMSLLNYICVCISCD